MPDPDGTFKTEAEKALDEIQAIADRLSSDQAATVGYVRVRIAVIIGILCLFTGFIAGHVQL